MEKNVPAVAVVKDGETTSEYRMAESASRQGWLGLIVAAVLAVGPAVMGTASEDSVPYLVAAIAVAVATQLQAIVLKGSYVNSRTTVKKAAEETRQAEILRPSVTDGPEYAEG